VKAKASYVPEVPVFWFTIQEGYRMEPSLTPVMIEESHLILSLASVRLSVGGMKALYS